MAINKVVYGDQTLMDLTQDSVEASNLLEGATAHDKSGAPVTGTAKQGHIIQDADGNNMTQRGTVQFPDSKVEDDPTNGRTVVRNLQDPMTVSQFDEAQNLDPGIYPLEGGEILDDSMIKHDANNTVKQALNKLSNLTVRDVSETYTGTLSTIVDVIMSILTIAQPHTWNVGLYQGKFISDHTGGGDLGYWSGFYSLSVGYQGSYGTRGIVVAQGYVFEFSYDVSSYIVHKAAYDYGSVSVTAGANETYGALFDRLATLVDFSKITHNAKIVINIVSNSVKQIFSHRYYDGAYFFDMMRLTSNNNMYSIRLIPSGGTQYYYALNYASTQNLTTDTVPEGTIVTLFY